MRVLVTGAAGFVGTNLVLRLLERGVDLWGTDSLARRGTAFNLARVRELHPSYRFEQREVEDLPALIFEVKPDIVYHFAAQVAVTNSMKSPLRDFRINAEGSFLVARAARDVGAAIVYTSTNKVYGDNVNRVPIVELETRYEFDGIYRGRGLPEAFSIDAAHHTPYGISKLVGELYTREFGGIANRCSCMYGPNQFGIVDQGWLSHIATSRLTRRPVTIYGDGKQLRDALHVRDVVRLLEMQGEALLSSRGKLAGEVFNIGGGHRNTVSLVELCRRWNIEPRFADWRPADQKVFYCDLDKAHRVLGWAPEVGLDEGLADLLRWTEDALARWGPPEAAE